MLSRNIFNTGRLILQPAVKIDIKITTRFYFSNIKNSSIFTNFEHAKIKQYRAPYSSMKGIHENISALQMKKRPVRKKKIPLEEDEVKPPGVFSAVAYATAEEYKLENLIESLIKQDLYEPKIFSKRNEVVADVVHARAKYQVETEPRDIYFFREGTCVFWNVTDLESSNVLSFIKEFEIESYSENLVLQEAEIMDYKYDSADGQACISDGVFVFPANKNVIYEKYTFSNAMALSVKLGMWEASLDRYIESIAFVTEDLKKGNKIQMTQEEVLRKHGELFALRHLINLSSDLLDTPDFYWERDQLETLYSQTCTYFSIPRRTKVMNEKINHCVELIELLSSHLSDKHHIRLEWMIIILIMVEVGFETLHYIDRIL